MPPEIANVEQAESWDGSEGDAWVRDEERYNAAIQRHHARLFERAQIGASERVLDIGCGCGETTREAARKAVDGSVFGVDLSARMIARARERAAQARLSNVSFEQADAQVRAFNAAAYDVALSRFGAMFFENRPAAFANIRRALRPGGRLVMIAWQALARNEWIASIRGVLSAGRTLPAPDPGTPGPFGLADQADTHSVLKRAGFTDISFEEVAVPIKLGADSNDAMHFVSGFELTKTLTQQLDPSTRARVIGELRELMRSHETPDGVLFGSSSWLISARAG